MGRQSDKRESESRNGSLRWQRDPKPVVARSLAPSARAESNPSIPVCLNQGGKTSVSNFLPGLLVLAIGGSILRPLLLLTILFLGSRRPLPNAGALALGYFATCAVIGISGLVLFGDAGSAVSTVGWVISITVGGLLIVLGPRSLLDAPDPDSSPPGWMESIDSMSPPRAFAFGLALFPLQVKNLAIFVACLNLIIASSLGPEGSIVALGLVLLVFAIPVVVLIGFYAAALQHASTVLGSLRTWMGKHNRAITVAICFVFGAFFLVRGLLAR
jgi:Sap, sulfolipid-1-addressing protein